MVNNAPVCADLLTRTDVLCYITTAAYFATLPHTFNFERYSLNFVHLHCHSGFSLVEGTTTIEQLVGAARRLKMGALALTDRNNMFGAIAFYRTALKAGIKPILGMDVDLDDGSSVVLLARDLAGYTNLCHLSSSMRLNADPEAFDPAGFDEEAEDPAIRPWDPGVWGVPVLGFTPRPEKLRSDAAVANRNRSATLAREVILSGRHARGLIALSGGRRGIVNSLVRQGKLQQAAKAAGMYVSAYGEGNFFIELTALDERDIESIPLLIALANELRIPIVAANDVLFLAREDNVVALALAQARLGARGRAARKADSCLFSGLDDETSTETRETHTLARTDVERYFKTAEDMASLFGGFSHGAQALANASYIAEQCNLELPLHKAIFPSVNLPSEETPFSALWKLCFAGATRRYQPLRQDVVARLKYEMEVIDALGFSTYFLVVQEIVEFAHTRGIPILARGSAANSLVAYVLGITQVDPLEYGLLFERFLSRERAEFELPDIDLDLCWRRRDEVLHHVFEKYGKEHVAIVGTHITFRLRSAWREMAKALDVSPARIDYIASRLSHLTREERAQEEETQIEVVEQPGETYSDSIEPPKLVTGTELQALGLARAIQGLPRHAGMHCGGVVITPDHLPLADLVPLQRAARDASLSITQFEKDGIEALGLVKMDLLGSRALTTLVDALNASGLVSSTDNVEQALEAIPFDDEQTFNMIANGDTLACFQLESPGMRSLVRWLRPHSLRELAMAVSLFRPGPLEGGFLETFMRRHLKQEPVIYPHPAMEPILKETYGVILYQEQFLRLAHTLAGLGLGVAEQLRKALGKASSAQERSRLGNEFIAGAIERGIDQMQAERVWEVISGYSGFGFCAAHAYSYALAAYRCAYMKAHFPAEYIAAALNNQGGYYGPSTYIEDARRMGVRLLAPHVNESGFWCEAIHSVKRRRSRRKGSDTAGGGRRDGSSIRIGLQFVRGLQERTIAEVVAERQRGGRFRSLFDLLARVNLSKAELTTLVQVGACDDLDAVRGCNLPAVVAIRGDFGEPDSVAYVPSMPELYRLNRKQLMHLVPQLVIQRKAVPGMQLTKLERLQRTGSEGGSPALQGVLSGFLHEEAPKPKILGNEMWRLHMEPMQDYTRAELLRFEQECLGFGLLCNEMELVNVSDVTHAADLHKQVGHEVYIAGTIASGHKHTGKDGRAMMFLTIQDCYGLIETVLFPDVYERCAEIIARVGRGPYVLKGRIQLSEKDATARAPVLTGLCLEDAMAFTMQPTVIVQEVSELAQK